MQEANEANLWSKLQMAAANGVEAARKGKKKKIEEKKRLKKVQITENLRQQSKASFLDFMITGN